MKIISLILALLIMLPILSACGGGEPSAQSGGEVTTASESVETEPEVTTAKDITWKDAEVPEKDYEGASFNIYSRNNTDYAWYRLVVDEINGEPLNDAIYNRNKTIAEAFNVDITVTLTASAASDMKKVVSAGDTKFDVFFNLISETIPMGSGGYIMNFYDMPYINLENDWWDQALVRDMTIADKLFMATGDISPHSNVRVFSLVFNKDLCTELGYDMPYQYVLDGTWTFDMFTTYAKNVNRDLNGDGVMDYEDMWGYFSQWGNSYMMFTAGGGRVAQTDADGIPQVTMDTQKNIDIITKALQISTDKDAVVMADPYVAANGNSWPAASAWFANGGSLLRSSVFEPVPRDYRTMETDFGVLPYPKFDEKQEQYYTLAEQYANIVSVPNTTLDPERTGIILEAMAAESVSTVSKAFYDVCLNGKYIRDEESSAMLDIIFDGKVFDIGFLLDIGGFSGKIKSLEQAGNTDVGSTYASIHDTAQGALDKIVTAYAALQ